MPEKATIERARQDAREGKSPSTQAGEFVREEIHHIREGKHGASSAKQAIAIGLSKARKAGVALPPPPGERGKRRRRATPRRKTGEGAGDLCETRARVAASPETQGSGGGITPRAVAPGESRREAPAAPGEPLA